jgi:uncharacterized delta-60 repeat protein
MLVILGCIPNKINLINGGVMVKQSCWIVVILTLVFFSIGTSQTQRWVYRYNAPGNSTDQASSLVYGGDGNIYIAGLSYGSGTSRDFTVISLTSTGTQRWVYRYNGPGDSTDVANSLVCSADGNIYVAGMSTGSGTGSDFTVISLDSTGTERWVYRYNGPGNGSDLASSLVYDADGNVYIAGYSTGSGTYYDFTVISLSSFGTQRWVYRYNGPANSWDLANSLVYGADGNVYIAGYSTGSGTSYDFTVISLSSTGTQRWVYRYNGPGNYMDYAYSLVYDADGNIYIAGYSWGTNYDFTVISLSSTGTERWVYRYNGPGNGSDVAYSLVYGTDGNIYVAGFSSGSGTDDFTVISLSSTGTQLWVYRYNGPGSGHNYAYSLAYGADGNIYVAGESWGIGTYEDFTVISLSSTGTQRWVYRYNGPGNYMDYAYSLVCGADGNIYVAGRSDGSGTDDDFTVISLNPAIGIEEETAVRFSQTAIRCFGNKIELSLSLSQPANIPISVYNITGEKVLAFDFSASVGTSHHEKDLSFLPTGVYIVKADIENRSLSKKFVVVK